MKFGIFYEHQLPRPWGPDDEHKLLKDALDQAMEAALARRAPALSMPEGYGIGAVMQA